MLAKKYLALICCGLFLAVGFGTSMALVLSRPAVQTSVQKETPEVAKEVPKPEEDAKPVYDIGMTEDVFRARYNQVAAENFNQYPIQLRQVQPYTFQHTVTYEDPFTDRLSMMVCRYQDTNLVKGVLISSHATDELDGIQFLSVIVSMLTVMEPDLTPKERGEFLKQLGMFSDSGHTDYRKINRSAERNGKRYFIRGNGENGVLFGVLGKDIQLDPAAAKANPTDDHNIIIDIVNYAIWLSKQQAPKETSQQEAASVTSPPMADIPLVKGMQVNEASALLKARGFRVELLRTYNPYIAEGTVTSQSPEPGREKVGSEVALSVADGATAEQARARLAQNPTMKRILEEDQRKWVQGNSR